MTKSMESSWVGQKMIEAGTHANGGMGRSRSNTATGDATGYAYTEDLAWERMAHAVMARPFLVLIPTPYVDASTAWSFPSKWKRMFVGAPKSHARSSRHSTT